MALTVIFSSDYARSETVKDREGAVRGDREKMQNNERWIYNDVDEGFRQAKATGKPLMVVLRCVPCLACMGIDTGVLIENPTLTPLMDQFIRVRVINTNSLELSKFQFDPDLSFSTLFFNADGTVYGRFGSWEHQKDSQLQATDTFRFALEQALKIHQNFPSNKTALAGKQGKPLPWKTPADMPILSEKYGPNLNWEGQVVKSCIHCHQIGDTIRRTARESGQPMPLQLIYSYPAPETIGIQFEKEHPLTIAEVTLDSPAHAAGLKSGDTLELLGQQPLISSADVSWVLHQSPDQCDLAAGVVSKTGDKKQITISLSDGWRRKASLERRVGTWPMRAMALGGMLLTELEEDERKAKGIADDQLALFAKHVGQYGKHALAKKQGFKKGDIILSINGDNSRRTESEWIGKLLREHKRGDKIPATILRGDKKMDLTIKTQ